MSPCLNIHGFTRVYNAFFSYLLTEVKALTDISQVLKYKNMDINIDRLKDRQKDIDRQKIDILLLLRSQLYL